jgi:hypothetical protein
MINQDPRATILGSQPSPFQQVATEAANPAVSRSLQQTQPWARFMGIVGFVMVGLMVLIGVAAGAAGIATGDAEAAVLLVIYPLIALLYIFPSLHLVRYANRIRDFVAHGQQSQLEAALEAQRAFWKFIGIVTLVTILMTVLILIAAMVIGIAVAV